MKDPPEQFKNKKKKTGTTKKKGAVQLKLFGAGMQFIDKSPLMLSKLVLLTDEVYKKKVPKGMEGKLFLSLVTGYEVEEKNSTLKYQNRMISVDGLEWVDQDGGRAILEGVKIKTVTTGHDLYGRA